MFSSRNIVAFCSSSAPTSVYGSDLPNSKARARPYELEDLHGLLSSGECGVQGAISVPA
jgi:hypothetical protein